MNINFKLSNQQVIYILIIILLLSLLFSCNNSSVVEGYNTTNNLIQDQKLNYEYKLGNFTLELIEQLKEIINGYDLNIPLTDNVINLYNDELKDRISKIEKNLQLLNKDFEPLTRNFMKEMEIFIQLNNEINSNINKKDIVYGYLIRSKDNLQERAYKIKARLIDYMKNIKITQGLEKEQKEQKIAEIHRKISSIYENLQPGQDQVQDQVQDQFQGQATKVNVNVDNTNNANASTSTEQQVSTSQQQGQQVNNNSLIPRLQQGASNLFGVFTPPRSSNPPPVIIDTRNRNQQQNQNPTFLPDGNEFIRRSKIVPPVCPACPPVIVDKNTLNQQCPPCPPCARCPEPSFECQKVPNYRGGPQNNFLPRAVLSDFSTFGM